MRDVTITIDGKLVEVKKGENILIAAQRVGIYIPSLCHHPDLPPSSGLRSIDRVFWSERSFRNECQGEEFQGCRLCLVEMEGKEDLLRACDTLVKDGLWDVYNDFHMGMTGEIIADKYGITREDCDKFALWSHQKAAKAAKEGEFKDEIVPVEIKQKKGNAVVFDKDEGIREDATLEKLAGLKTVFKSDGVITAGNASQITDGAAAVVVMSRDKAKEKGIEPLVTIKGYNTSGVKPENVMEAPVPGVKTLLKKTGLSMDDIDLVEHNEAFSSASVVVMKELGIKREIFNVHGGAVALGHPIGASGARILVTLIHAMRNHDKTRGLATLCLGGGNAVSILYGNSRDWVTEV